MTHDLDRLRHCYEDARDYYVSALLGQVDALVRRKWPTATALRISVRPEWEYEPTSGEPRTLDWVDVHDVRDQTDRVLFAAIDPDDPAVPDDTESVADGGHARLEQAAATLSEIARVHGPTYWPQRPPTGVEGPADIVVHSRHHLALQLATPSTAESDARPTEQD